MPTYQYRCTECDYDFEAVQKFSDAALTQCPQCNGGLRKVFSPAAVVFKGSGFYATDNKTKGAAAAASAPATDAGSSPTPATPSAGTTPAASTSNASPATD